MPHLLQWSMTTTSHRHTESPTHCFSWSFPNDTPILHVFCLFFYLLTLFYFLFLRLCSFLDSLVKFLHFPFLSLYCILNKNSHFHFFLPTCSWWEHLDLCFLGTTIPRGSMKNIHHQWQLLCDNERIKLWKEKSHCPSCHGYWHTLLEHSFRTLVLIPLLRPPEEMSSAEGNSLGQDCTPSLGAALSPWLTDARYKAWFLYLGSELLKRPYWFWKFP
jgi:hypothetical protein